jgi:hypothetical protein
MCFVAASFWQRICAPAI